jgi:hypothetical protein
VCGHFLGYNQVTRQLHVFADLAQSFVADDLSSFVDQLLFAELGELVQQSGGDQKIENCVAEVFEQLIVVWLDFALFTEC